MGFLKSDLDIESWLENKRISFDKLSDQQYIYVQSQLDVLLGDTNTITNNFGSITLLLGKLPTGCFIVDNKQTRASFGYFVDNLTTIDADIFKNENAMIAGKNFSFCGFFNLVSEMFLEIDDKV